MRIVIDAISLSTIEIVFIIAIILDTILGMLQAIKLKKFNSSFGTNGVIRKIAMIITIVMLELVDSIIQINLIGFVPQEILTILHIQQIGLADFFSLLYLAFETTSILRNMCALKLPVFKKFRTTLLNFLQKYSGEVEENGEKDDGQDHCN